MVYNIGHILLHTHCRGTQYSASVTCYYAWYAIHVVYQVVVCIRWRSVYVSICRLRGIWICIYYAMHAPVEEV